jgi:hypothetical protein
MPNRELFYKWLEYAGKILEKVKDIISSIDFIAHHPIED